MRSLLNIATMLLNILLVTLVVAVGWVCFSLNEFFGQLKPGEAQTSQQSDANFSAAELAMSENRKELSQALNLVMAEDGQSHVYVKTVPLAERMKAMGNRTPASVENPKPAGMQVSEDQLKTAIQEIRNARNPWDKFSELGSDNLPLAAEVVRYELAHSTNIQVIQAASSFVQKNANLAQSLSANLRAQISRALQLPLSEYRTNLLISLFEAYMKCPHEKLNLRAELVDTLRDERDQNLLAGINGLFQEKFPLSEEVFQISL